METVSTHEVYRREGYPMVESNEIGGRSLFRIDPDGKCDPAKILRTMRQSVVPRSQKTLRENVTRFSPLVAVWIACTSRSGTRSCPANKKRNQTRGREWKGDGETARGQRQKIRFFPSWNREVDIIPASWRYNNGALSRGARRDYQEGCTFLVLFIAHTAPPRLGYSITRRWHRGCSYLSGCLV